MAFTEGKTKRECSYLRGLVGWKRTKSHGGCVLNERARVREYFFRKKIAGIWIENCNFVG